MEQNFKTIEFLKEGLVVNIRLNRPDIHNALNPLMIAELTAAFTEIANQAELRLVTLRGNGPSFCAGADLNYMKEIAGLGKRKTWKMHANWLRCSNNSDCPFRWWQ